MDSSMRYQQSAEYEENHFLLYINSKLADLVRRILSCLSLFDTEQSTWFFFPPLPQKIDSTSSNKDIERNIEMIEIQRGNGL